MITEIEIKLINHYAEKHLESSFEYYRLRNSNLSKSKALADIKLGKMAELGLYKILKAENKIVSKPDLEIYKSNQKSYAADLMAFDFKNVYHLHVKCISENFWARGIKSVLLERNDKIVSRQHDCKNHFLVIMRKINNYNFEAVKWLHVPDVKYQDPINRNMKSKVAVYI